MKIANEIYGYSKSAADGIFKHPRKGIKMDRTTEDVAAPVLRKILEPYKLLNYKVAECMVRSS